MHDVNKHFGDLHVLKNIDLAVSHGEVLVVIGPSGSGKSTLCRSINGLERIDSGEIRLDGVAIPTKGKELARFRATIGMVFQSFNLFSHMTILENVMLGPVKAQQTPKKQVRDAAMELLSRVGIDSKANSLPAELSGGQQQRAAIARALIMDPKIVLFDEPTSALDPEMIVEVLEVIESLADSGMTMLIVTHEMGFAASVAHRVLFMSEGQVVEQGAAREFFRNPQSERARAFLSKVLHNYQG
jgi:glutamate transport system ATP-binding protein